LDLTVARPVSSRVRPQVNSSVVPTLGSERSVLLCLNSEWQGCESPELERGSRLLAGELFGDLPHLDFGPSHCDDLSLRDGVFALGCVADRFARVLGELQRAAPERIFTIGGTCGAEAAPVAYLSARYPGFGVVWLDAHGDMNTPASSPTGHFHGLVLRTLLGDGPEEFTARITPPLDPRRVVVAGVRDLDAAEREFITSAGVGLVEGWPDAAAACMSALLRVGGVQKLYVHVDVDVFDPGSFGDALLSVPGGPSLASVAASVRELVSGFDVVGVGVVESCGRTPGATTALASFLVDSGLRLAAQQRAEPGDRRMA
jgi:arginase